MTDARTPAPGPTGRSGRVTPAPLTTDPVALAAAAEVAEARAALAGEIDGLKASARAAVDIKAKVRRIPGKTAAAAGGAAFLAVGGPRRVIGALKRRVVGAPDPLPASLLPDEVEKAVSALADDGAKVRGALERGFAGWLDATAKGRKAEKRQRSLVNLALRIGVPAATKAAQQVVSRAFAETKESTRPESKPAAASTPDPDAAPPGRAPRSSGDAPGGRPSAG